MSCAGGGRRFNRKANAIAATQTTIAVNRNGTTLSWALINTNAGVQFNDAYPYSVRIVQSQNSTREPVAAIDAAPTRRAAAEPPANQPNARNRRPGGSI